MELIYTMCVTFISLFMFIMKLEVKGSFIAIFLGYLIMKIIPLFTMIYAGMKIIEYLN